MPETRLFEFTETLLATEIDTSNISSSHASPLLFWLQSPPGQCTQALKRHLKTTWGPTRGQKTPHLAKTVWKTYTFDSVGRFPTKGQASNYHCNMLNNRRALVCDLSLKIDIQASWTWWSITIKHHTARTNAVCFPSCPTEVRLLIWWTN